MNNTPAFPIPRHTRHFDDSQGAYMQDDGMSLRDYFAAKAMQALISLPETFLGIHKKTITADQICGSCYEWADEMMKAREE
jgi:hypothetical protein